MMDPALKKTHLLIVEWALLFVLPVFVYLWQPYSQTLLLMLTVGLGYALFWLYRQKINWRQEWVGRPMRGHWWGFVLRLLFVTACSAVLTAILIPERLFALPKHSTQLWLMVMLLYPLASALPQEIIFRSFFFRRFPSLFPSRILMVLANSFAFAFIHIIFHNWVAPFLSLFVGFMLANSYAQHRSLRLVWIEHALYGCLAFTFGLGWFFYHGARG
jgi:membrane protease YdiL (CAAX protease family)